MILDFSVANFAIPYKCKRLYENISIKKLRMLKIVNIIR